MFGNASRQLSLDQGSPEAPVTDRATFLYPQRQLGIIANVHGQACRPVRAAFTRQLLKNRLRKP